MDPCSSLLGLQSHTLGSSLFVSILWLPWPVSVTPQGRTAPSLGTTAVGSPPVASLSCQPCLLVQPQPTPWKDAQRGLFVPSDRGAGHNTPLCRQLSWRAGFFAKCRQEDEGKGGGDKKKEKTAKFLLDAVQKPLPSRRKPSVERKQHEVWKMLTPPASLGMLSQPRGRSHLQLKQQLGCSPQGRPWASPSPWLMHKAQQCPPWQEQVHQNRQAKMPSPVFSGANQVVEGP